MGAGGLLLRPPGARSGAFCAHTPSSGMPPASSSGLLPGPFQPFLSSVQFQGKETLELSFLSPSLDGRSCSSQMPLEEHATLS